MESCFGNLGYILSSATWIHFSDFCVGVTTKSQDEYNVVMGSLVEREQKCCRDFIDELRVN